MAISEICETTRRNIISEATALVFLFFRKYVCKPIALTSELLEHNFNFFKGIIREFTVMQLVKLLKRIKRIIDVILKGEFQTAKGRKKGYSSTLGSYIQSNIESV